MRPLAAVLVLGITGACASAGSVVPATAQTITSGLALGDLPESAGDVWMDNRSSGPIRVISVTLHDCINVQPTCNARIALDVKVNPGTRAIVYHVLRKVPYEPYRLTFYTEWRPDSASAPAAR